MGSNSITEALLEICSYLGLYAWKCGHWETYYWYEHMFFFDLVAVIIKISIDCVLLNLE